MEHAFLRDCELDTSTTAHSRLQLEPQRALRWTRRISGSGRISNTAVLIHRRGPSLRRFTSTSARSLPTRAARFFYGHAALSLHLPRSLSLERPRPEITP